MAQYISKDALVAEIERRKKYYENIQMIKPVYESNIEDFNELLSFLNTLDVKEVQEEPVSEELEKASKKWLSLQLDKSYTNYGEAKMMELTHFDGYAMLDAIDFGAKWKKEHLWKSADGDDLPEIDREVIALEGIVDPIAIDCLCGYKVIFAHRPTTEGYDGKSIITGETEHYTPKTYDKGGWNVPNIIYWLDVELPKEIEL